MCRQIYVFKRDNSLFSNTWTCRSYKRNNSNVYLISLNWFFFLLHFAFVRWDYSLIYCTELTAEFLKHKFQLPDERLYILPFNEKIYLPIIKHKSKEIIDNCKICEVWFSVTVLEANHCPGACMFLFEGYFGMLIKKFNISVF